MPTVTVDAIVATGTPPATNTPTPATGDKIKPGRGVFLLVHNGSGASIDVTLVTPGKVAGDLDIADRVVAVPAGEDRYIAVGDIYRGSDGLATFVCSDTTSVTFTALRI